MAATVSTDNQTISSDYGYRSTCPLEYRQYTFQFKWKSSEVTSYRGEPKYVTVGSKRRKAFNAFNRYRQTFNPKMTTGCITHSNPLLYRRTIWGENYAIQHWWSKMPVWPETTAAWYSGDVCPFATRISTANYGEVLRKFVDRDLHIKANEPDFDGAVFVAELGETVQELRRIFQGVLTGLLKTGKKKKSSALVHFLLNPEELWLWYRYFLLPAMMDAENIMKAINPIAEIDRVQDGSRATDQVISGVGDINLSSEIHCTAEFRTVYSYGIGGAMDISRRFDPHRWGFSAFDMVRAAWERIPFSFVFDWFVNFGDWLASIREIVLEVEQSYSTYAIDATTEITFDSRWNLDTNPVTTNLFLMDRKTDVVPPKTPLVDKNWVNVLRVVDAISLIVGILKRLLAKQRR